MWYVALGWQWHAIEFAQTSAILQFYTWFRFRPHHRSRHVILQQSPTFYPNRTTLGRKNDVMSIFKMADLSHLDFRNPIMGSFKSPGTTSYRSSIETTIICSIFLHFGDRQTNRQTNEQMDTTDALSRSRCRKRRLNNIQRHFMSSMFSDDVHQISSYRAKRPTSVFCKSNTNSDARTYHAHHFIFSFAF